MQVVAIRDIIPPPQRRLFNDVYIAYELMDTDLHQIIRSNQALSEEHCQVFIISCLFSFFFCSRQLEYNILCISGLNLKNCILKNLVMSKGFQIYKHLVFVISFSSLINLHE